MNKKVPLKDLASGSGTAADRARRTLELDNALFLERRAAMRHAIRLLREAGDKPGNHICTIDANTLHAWLDELQEQR
jgi:hypothetical protein